MKLDDLLYHLQHTDALDQLDHQTLTSLIRQYPYLESLKSAYYKKYPGQNNVHFDLNEKLSDLVQSAFSEGHDSLLPPVFDLKQEEPIINNEADAKLPVLEEGLNLEDLSVPAQIEEADHKPLYSYTQSGFISFLKSMPSCKVPMTAVAIPEAKEDHTKQTSPEYHELPANQVIQTEELIKSSLDLRDTVGSESLANLWAHQGKPELAIQIYEKLLAENPEKSSIFAAKIEKLKAEYSL